MIKKYEVAVILLLCLTGVTGCINQTTIQPGTDNTIASGTVLLMNGTWCLIDAKRDAIFEPLISGTDITLVFSPDGSFSGSSGCNTYNGIWSVNGNSMKFSPIRMTKQVCESSSIMRAEKLYIPLLQETATYSVTEENLMLTGDSACTLVYTREV